MVMQDFQQGRSYREDTDKKMNCIESFSYFKGTNNNTIIIFGKDRFFRIEKFKKIFKPDSPSSSSRYWNCDSDPSFPMTSDTVSIDNTSQF
jgi:hypothetical protein